MMLPPATRFPFTADLSLCRILGGLWQVSGAHGPIDPDSAVPAMFAYHDSGFTTWDLADHYGPAEDFIGAFRRRFAAERGAERLVEIQAFTKWVPPPGMMTRQVVERAVGVSLRRMGTDRLDLLQFHFRGTTAGHAQGLQNRAPPATDSCSTPRRLKLTMRFFAYHAMPNNFDPLVAFRYHIMALWMRTLTRRSQKDSTDWDRINRLADQWLPRPRILDSWPNQRFAVKHPGWEPDAVLCGGCPPVVDIPAAIPQNVSLREPEHLLSLKSCRRIGQTQIATCRS
jgi:hypothetical protein